MPSSPLNASIHRPRARAIAVVRPALMLQGTALFVLLMALTIANRAHAADDLPPLPPLPGMQETVTQPQHAAAPSLKEMPALPSVEAPTPMAAPALENATVGQPRALPDLPPAPPLPGVTGTSDVASVPALPDTKNVGPGEIDSWLKDKAPVVDTAALPEAPSLPTEIPNTEIKKADAELKPVTETAANREKAANKVAKEEKPKKKTQTAKKAPAKAAPFYSFQYKSQFMPDAIYRPEYTAENKHLPKARYEQDYDRYVFQAASRNDAAGLRALLNTPGRTTEIFDPNGQTPLMVAVRYGATQAAQTLLSYGADADHRDNSGVSILHYAVLARNAALVQSLLAAHANPQSRDPWGQTPLDLANYAKDGATISLLRSALQPQQATLGQPRS